MTVKFPGSKMYEVGKIEMEVFEQGEGFPVILAHGFPELAYSWRLQMPALAEAGYRAIAPNQRGYGQTSKPESVEAYDIINLCGDMAGLLDALGLDKAVFVGHDWGGPVVWNMPLLHPDRVAGVVGMSVPFQPRAAYEPIATLERFFGPDHYIVHFNRQPGVADKAFADNPEKLFTNIFRKNMRRYEAPALAAAKEDSSGGGPSFNVSILNTMALENPPGEPLMSDEELQVFVDAFSRGGFTGPINWYRNINRNWELSEGREQKINVPCAMIFGSMDIVPKGGDVSEYVPNLESITLDCGHWIQQEKPEETNEFLLNYLKKNFPV